MLRVPNSTFPRSTQLRLRVYLIGLSLTRSIARKFFSPRLLTRIPPSSISLSRAPIHSFYSLSRRRFFNARSARIYTRLRVPISHTRLMQMRIRAGRGVGARLILSRPRVTLFLRGSFTNLRPRASLVRLKKRFRGKRRTWKTASRATERIFRAIKPARPWSLYMKFKTCPSANSRDDTRWNDFSASFLFGFHAASTATLLATTFLPCHRRFIESRTAEKRF